MAPTKNDPILIIGAGIFGLSTAIHLAQRGFKNVTVIDKQNYDKTFYSYDAGCDAASAGNTQALILKYSANMADINKIMRCAYGADMIHQNLAIEALRVWEKWNVELSETSETIPGIAKSDVLYVNNGNVIVNTTPSLSDFELESIASMKAVGEGSTQFVVQDAADNARARESGYGYALDPFHQNGKGYCVLLDIAGGLLNADKACSFALHKARSLGVRFVFGPSGTFKSFITPAAEPKVVNGVVTEDGTRYEAAITIAAGGGWTPTIVPELDGLCETTAGSVFFYQIPRDSPLWDRFAPENFPSYSYAMRAGASGGIYGFPRDSAGRLKIGYRGTKYTNPVIQPDGKERSTPRTRWTSEAFTAVPAQAHQVVQKFVSEFMPELAEHGIKLTSSRVCWYNDSFDNNLVIDHVAGRKGLMVASGGSGHAFKYLPVVGKYVVDVLEGVEKGEALRKWAWRSLDKGQAPKNVIMQGSEGDRVLFKQDLVADEDLNGKPGVKANL